MSIDPLVAGDPRLRLQEATRSIREALAALREGVVQAGIRRNELADALAARRAMAVDLETKAGLAEKINSPAVAAEIRAERDRVNLECAQLQEALVAAEAAAETAKLTLPENEARLLQQLNELKSDFARQATARVSAGHTEADDLLDRAISKIQGIVREATAYTEMPGARIPVRAEIKPADETA